MIVVKIMDDGIHWVAAVYHVGSVFNITVNFSRIAGSTFPYVGLFPDADEYSDDKSKADCQKGMGEYGTDIRAGVVISGCGGWK